MTPSVVHLNTGRKAKTEQREDKIGMDEKIQLTEELKAKLKDCKTAEEVMELARANGLNISLDDAKLAFANLEPLSSEDLDKVAGGCCTDNFCHGDCCGGCRALGLSTSGDEYHPDLTKCLFFEKGYYGKIAGVMSGWKNLSAVSGAVGDGPNGA